MQKTEWKHDQQVGQTAHVHRRRAHNYTQMPVSVSEIFKFSIKHQTVRRIWHNCVYEIYVAPLLGFIFRTWRFRYADPYLTKQTWKAFWTVCMLDMSRKFWLTQMIRDRWMARQARNAIGYFRTTWVCFYFVLSACDGMNEIPRKKLFLQLT